MKKTTREIFFSNQSRSVPAGFEATYLWLHNIRSMHNVGSAFRTADALGIKGLILSGYTPSPPRPELSKTALGADETVHWHYFKSDYEAIQYLRDNKYSIVALEQTNSSIPIHEIRPGESGLCMLMGNEVNGIEDDLLLEADLIAEIPQYGQKHSFNVSVAAGIALYALHECYRLR